MLQGNNTGSLLLKNIVSFEKKNMRIMREKIYTMYIKKEKKTTFSWSSSAENRGKFEFDSIKTLPLEDELPVMIWVEDKTGVTYESI